jgi:RNA polymerase sigma factor (sigma-70 family)
MRVRRARPSSRRGRRGGVVGVATRRALTAVTAATTTAARIVPDHASAAAAAGSPPSLATGPAGDARVQDLLRQRADLPAGHPDRAVLRTRSIEAGLPLARCLATRYRGRGEPLDDLYQVAALALVKAVDGYDPVRQAAFTSYAVPTILGALKRHFRDTTWRARVPRRTKELAINLAPASARLAQQLARSPALPELAPLRCGTGGRVEPAPGPWSDRVGEFGERSGDPRGRRCVEAEFVVAAAQVLHEGVPCDDHLCCVVRP